MALKEGDPANPAIKLGRLCVEKDIPVYEVAKALGVSRQTIYTWFTGRFYPRDAAMQRIEELLVALKAQ